jgi:hypothetical protein
LRWSSGVSIGPGLTTLTRMPSATSSLANTFIAMYSPALAAA